MGSKYNVDTSAAGKARRTYKGITFRSLAERRYAEELERRRRAGEITSWQYEPMRVTLAVGQQAICTYTPDFIITFPDETVCIVEIKGHVTAEWRLKEKLFRATWLKDHPEVGFEVVT